MSRIANTSDSYVFNQMGHRIFSQLMKKTINFIRCYSIVINRCWSIVKPSYVNIDYYWSSIVLDDVQDADIVITIAVSFVGVLLKISSLTCVQVQILRAATQYIRTLQDELRKQRSPASDGDVCSSCNNSCVRYQRQAFAWHHHHGYEHRHPLRW